MRDFSLLEFFGYRLELRWTVAVGSVAVWVFYILVYQFVIGFNGYNAVLLGAVSMVLHWVVVMYHHYGHFSVAYEISYPIHHVAFEWGWGQEIYMAEDDAPPESRIRRLLGGIFHSVGFSLTLGGVSIFMFLFFTPIWWVALFAWLECFFIYTILMSLPLKIGNFETDGYQIRQWRRVLVQANDT